MNSTFTADTSATYASRPGHDHAARLPERETGLNDENPVHRVLGTAMAVAVLGGWMSWVAYGIVVLVLVWPLVSRVLRGRNRARVDEEVSV